MNYNWNDHYSYTDKWLIQICISEVLVVICVAFVIIDTFAIAISCVIISFTYTWLGKTPWKDKADLILFNKNYIEIESDVLNVKGGEYQITKDGIRYYIHEYNDTEEKQIKWINKYGNNQLSSSYWPHFSQRALFNEQNICKFKNFSS